MVILGITLISAYLLTLGYIVYLRIDYVLEIRRHERNVRKSEENLLYMLNRDAENRLQ